MCVFLACIPAPVSTAMIEEGSKLTVNLIERQKGNRRLEQPVGFPLTDSLEVFVSQDRRRLLDRRREKYDVDDLDDKVCYLKTTVYATPLEHALTTHDSIVISRVLDEISIGELIFLLECHDNISDSGNIEGFYSTGMSSSDGEQAIGLMNLGLLARGAAEGTGSDVGACHFTPLAGRLVKLLAEQNAKQ